MQLLGTYYDGQIADPRAVICTIRGTEESGFFEIRDIEIDHKIAQWALGDLISLPTKRDELRLSVGDGATGARVHFSQKEIAEFARLELPILARYRRGQQGRQVRLIGIATAAMASVVIAYIYGIPLFADRIVSLIPPDVETRFGDKVVVQMADALAEQGGLQICDPDPNSLANRAIGRFAQNAIENTQSPFMLNVQVVANSIPNAFALPGGRAFYFQGLLENTQTADEFAGVLAHEIGHVVNRDGMQQLVATAGTGLLVGFLLGDITGLSLAGGIGAALIDTSFSRDAERAADQFALEVARLQAFQPTGLADLLERISQDDSSAQVFALLSTHPLTEERRAALADMNLSESDVSPAFSDEEWQAIQTMCDSSAPSKIKTKQG